MFGLTKLRRAIAALAEEIEAWTGLLRTARPRLAAGLGLKAEPVLLDTAPHANGEARRVLARKSK